MNYNFLTKTALFRGTTEKEAESMLHCLQASSRVYRKNEAVCRSGDQIHSLGMMLSGSVNIENDDVWGNKNILDNVGAGQVFAETYACLPEEPLMVSVTAAEDSEILFLNVEKILTACPTACPHHVRLIRNLVSVMARKNLNLTHKIFHTSPKSIRDRLLSYLSAQAVTQGKYRFEIPFNRQQLADYLRVDRSAMSNELSKMKKEGLITFEKNSFCLKKPAEQIPGEKNPDEEIPKEVSPKNRTPAET